MIYLRMWTEMPKMCELCIHVLSYDCININEELGVSHLTMYMYVLNELHRISCH